MTELAHYLSQYVDAADCTVRPGAPRSAPTPPGPAPQVNSADLAFAARVAVREVLPAAWQRLPDGQDTSLLLAGTLANHYASQQQAQAERLAAATAAGVGEVDQDDGLPAEAEGPSPVPG